LGELDKTVRKKPGRTGEEGLLGPQATKNHYELYICLSRKNSKPEKSCKIAGRERLGPVKGQICTWGGGGDIGEKIKAVGKKVFEIAIPDDCKKTRRNKNRVS